MSQGMTIHCTDSENIEIQGFTIFDYYKGYPYHAFWFMQMQNDWINVLGLAFSFLSRLVVHHGSVVGKIDHLDYEFSSLPRKGLSTVSANQTHEDNL